MAVLEVRDFRKSFAGFDAVRGVSFSLEEGEILAIVGPSGCGKTTTLRCIAGLERPTGGEIAISGKLVAGEGVFLPPEKRDIGMVFQSYALWPNKTVYQNIAYGLEIRRQGKDQIAEAVRQGLELVGLSGLDKRYPSELSGGQQQRVALARSAVTRPSLLLLDEPLSNLDAKLRERMRDDIKALIKALRISAVHITHDQTEAMGIADRIIVMRDGNIEQEGSARDLYRRPANKFVADFIGSVNFIAGSVVAGAGDLVTVRVAEGVDFVVRHAAPVSAGSRVTMAFRPEEARVSAPDAGANCCRVRVVEATFLGSYSQYLVDHRGVRFKLHSHDDFAMGSELDIAISPELISLFPEEEAAARKAAE